MTLALAALVATYVATYAAGWLMGRLYGREEARETSHPVLRGWSELRVLRRRSRLRLIESPRPQFYDYETEDSA